MDITVEQLLRGSDKVDKMRREIDFVIKIIRGFLTKKDISRFRDKEICNFACAELHWNIRAVKDDILVTVADPMIKDVLYFGNPTIIYFSYIIRDTALRYVQPLHQGLPVFLSTMIKIFPQLENRLTPLLKAAE